MLLVVVGAVAEDKVVQQEAREWVVEEVEEELFNCVILMLQHSVQRRQLPSEQAVVAAPVDRVEPAEVAVRVVKRHLVQILMHLVAAVMTERQQVMD